MFFSFIFMGMVKEFLFINPLNTVRILVKDASINLGLQIKNSPPVLLHRTLPDPPCLKCLWSLWSGCALLYMYPCFFWGTNLGCAFLQSQDKCPTSLHLKQAPFLISSVFSSTVIMLTSIAFRSGLGLKLVFWDPFSFFWAGDFPADQVIVQFQTCHPWWIFMAHLYQSAKLVGALGNITIFCCNPQERVSLKQSMTAVGSIISVFVKSDLKWATCLSMFPVGPLNLISFISAHVSPVWSKGLNVSKKSVSKHHKGAEV